MDKSSSDGGEAKWRSPGVSRSKQSHNKGVSIHPYSRTDSMGDGGNEGVHKAQPEHGISPGGTTSRLPIYHHVRSTKWSLQVQAPCIQVEHGLPEVQSHHQTAGAGLSGTTITHNSSRTAIQHEE